MLEVKLAVFALFVGLWFIWMKSFPDTNRQGLQEVILLQFVYGQKYSHWDIAKKMIEYTKGNIIMDSLTLCEYLDDLVQEGRLHKEPITSNDAQVGNLGVRALYSLPRVS